MDKRIEEALELIEKPGQTREAKLAALKGLMDADQWGPGNRFEAFDRVIVDDRLYELGFGEHPYSRRDNNFYARPIGRDGDEPTGFDGHRRPWRIEIMESNYMKSSGLSGDEVRQACGARLYQVLPARGPSGVYLKLIYAFGHRTAEACLQRIPGIMAKLSDFPVDLGKGEGPEDFSDLVGRKVYYQHVPAQVRYYFPDQGAVVVEPVDGHLFPLAPWQKEDMDDPFVAKEEMESAKVDLFTEHLWWFRK